MEDSPKQKGARRGAVALVFVLLSLLATSIPPAYNWDMVAYIALAESWVNPGADSQAVHESTWADVWQNIPRQQFLHLRGAHLDPDSTQWPLEVIGYRRAVAEDPEVLKAQMPFYSVKPLYPALIAGLTVLGLSAVFASVLVTKASWVAMGCFVFVLLRRRFALLPSLIALLISMSLPIVRALGGYSTPDALCSLFVLAGLYFALDANTRLRQRLALASCVLAVIARPDSILLVTPIALWLAARQPKQWREPASAVVCALVACGLQSHFSDNYGWAVLFHHSFIDYLQFPGAVSIELRLSDVISIYLSQLLSTGLFWGVVGIAVVVAVLRLRWLGVQDDWFCGLLVVIVFMATHWMVFPDQKDRMMVASYLFVLVAAVQFVAEWFGRGIGFTVSQKNRKGYDGGRGKAA